MTAMKRRLKARKAYAGSHWLHRLVRWFRDLRDVRECKEILWAELDRDRDETESLRTITVVAANALHRERNSSANIPDRASASD
jgi:DNA-binding PadR family transcriptional regulator